MPNSGTLNRIISDVRGIAAALRREVLPYAASGRHRIATYT